MNEYEWHQKPETENMYKHLESYNYYDGQVVFYDLKDGKHSGIATVVGCATIGVPVLGKQYIIKPLLPIQCMTYPFNYTICFESWMRPLDWKELPTQ